jgi:hypothetical protein
MVNANRNAKKARMANVSQRTTKNHPHGENVKITKNYLTTRKLAKTALNTPRNLVMVNYAWVNCVIKGKNFLKMVPANNAIHICVAKINTLVDLTFAKMGNNSEKMERAVHAVNSTGCPQMESNASKTSVTTDNSFKKTEPVNTAKHSPERLRTTRLANLISVRRINSCYQMVHARSAHHIQDCIRRDHAELLNA